KNPVRVVRERGPDFLTVHDIVIAPAHSAGFQRGEIAPRAGLGVPLAPEIVAVIDARQEAPLLRVAAETKQHGAAHREAERDERRAAGVAPFARPGGRDPAFLCQNAMPAQELVLGEVRIALDLLAQLGGQIRAEPGAHLIAERELLGGVIEVHGGGSAQSTAEIELTALFDGFQRMLTPPSATMHWPVMNAAASDARNTAMPAISRGSPSRLSGVAAMRSARRVSSSQSARAKSVLIRPGAMALTRTFFGPHSAARLRTRWCPAALEMP